MDERGAPSVSAPQASQLDAAGLAQSLRSRSRRAGSHPAGCPAAGSACREFGAPLLCRGGGTSLAGQCCNVAVILDFSKYMSRILEIDPARRIARVQPGVVLDTLRHAPCPNAGILGNNPGGAHHERTAKTDDNIEELEVVTHDGPRLTVGEGF